MPIFEKNVHLSHSSIQSLKFQNLSKMSESKKINRRQFLGMTGSAVALTVVPRHVLGGANYVAPSDKINLGLIGCGTQQIRELTSLITDERVQVVSICDPAKNPVGYADWSPNGIRNSVRQLLGDSSWGANIKGIPAGRDMCKEVVDKYYSNVRPGGSYRGCTAYSDFREMLEKERDMDTVKIITPDHQHGIQAIMSMKKGKNVIMHKPVANIVHEARQTVKTARETGVVTHLLAWAGRNQYDVVKDWIDQGAIGTLKEIHNWSFRPVWPQWPQLPEDRPPVPEGFDWDLWLGPVPDRPYHPNFTHNVYRGWYDFGAGSVADMGIYSLWPVFTKFGITVPPVSIEALGTTTNIITPEATCQMIVNQHSFPHSCIFRWKFKARGSSPALDLFWYDGGMKPHNPPEMEADGNELPREGMMFVGDKGKIIGGFHANNPRIIPESRMIEFTGQADPPPTSTQSGTDVWINAVLKGEMSPGSFQSVEVCNETTLLPVVALKAGRKVIYDPEKMEITNPPDANRFLYREAYRSGWEI